MTKNDQKIAKIEPPHPVKVVIPTIFEFSILENLKISEGIYIGITGPSLETSAERRFLAQCGGDAVGMSTVMEVIAAKQVGFQIIGLSAITNKADGGPDQRPDTIEDVLLNANTAGQKILKILPELIEDWCK